MHCFGISGEKYLHFVRVVIFGTDKGKKWIFWSISFTRRKFKIHELQCSLSFITCRTLNITSSNLYSILYEKTLNLSNTYLATYCWKMIYLYRSFKICCKLDVERNVFVIWLLFIQPHFLVELFVRSANNKHMSNKTSRLHGGFNDKLLTFCKSLWLRCILQVLLASPTLRYCYQRQFVKEKMSSIYFGKIYSQAI